MPEYVRVTDEVKPRREYTITAARAKSLGSDVKVLDKPATGQDGHPLPPKYAPTKTSGASASGSKAATEPADTKASPATTTKEK